MATINPKMAIKLSFLNFHLLKSNPIIKKGGIKIQRVNKSIKPIVTKSNKKLKKYLIGGTRYNFGFKKNANAGKAKVKARKVGFPFNKK